jgi:hypothetical protein
VTLPRYITLHHPMLPPATGGHTAGHALTVLPQKHLGVTHSTPQSTGAQLQQLRLRSAHTAVGFWVQHWTTKALICEQTEAQKPLHKHTAGTPSWHQQTGRNTHSHTLPQKAPTRPDTQTPLQHIQRDQRHQSLSSHAFSHKWFVSAQCDVSVRARRNTTHRSA